MNLVIAVTEPSPHLSNMIKKAQYLKLQEIEA